MTSNVGARQLKVLGQGVGFLVQLQELQVQMITLKALLKMLLKKLSHLNS
jgi:hypothetical protein